MTKKEILMDDISNPKIVLVKFVFLEIDLFVVIT